MKRATIDELFTLAQGVSGLMLDILRGGLRLIERGKSLLLLRNCFSLAMQLQLLAVTKLFEQSNDLLNVSFAHGRPNE